MTLILPTLSNKEKSPIGIVDDTPDIREMFGLVFKIGYPDLGVLSYGSHEELLVANGNRYSLIAKSFSLLVFDLGLPGIGTDTVLDNLLVLNTSLPPILICTGSTSEQFDRKRYPMVGFITKPFDLKTVLPEAIMYARRMQIIH